MRPPLVLSTLAGGVHEEGLGAQGLHVLLVPAARGVNHVALRRALSARDLPAAGQPAAGAQTIAGVFCTD